MDGYHIHQNRVNKFWLTNNKHTLYAIEMRNKSSFLTHVNYDVPDSFHFVNKIHMFVYWILNRIAYYS